MDRHTAIVVVKIIAVLNALGSALAIGSGLWLVLFGETAALSFAGQEAAFAVFLVPIVGLMLLIFGIAGLLVAFGLWQRKRWARQMIIFYAGLTVLNPPGGTILGLLELWLFGFDKDIQAVFK